MMAENPNEQYDPESGLTIHLIGLDPERLEAITDLWHEIGRLLQDLEGWERTDGFDGSWEQERIDSYLDDITERLDDLKTTVFGTLQDFGSEMP
jgi:hypothetical protein